MRRKRPVHIALFLSVLVAAAALTPLPSQAQAITRARLFGATRYGTAVAICKAEFSRADAVILADGNNYPDALAASALAAAEGAPILLTDGKTLDVPTLQEIVRLGATHAILLGGPAVVSPAVEELLPITGVTDVRRIYGKDRYATAAKLASEAVAIKPTDTVALCSGNNFPDALAMSALGFPVLFAQNGKLPDVTSAFIRDHHIAKVLIAGGTAAVSAAAEKSLKALGVGTVRRSAGGDRYETAALIANTYFTGAKGIFVATGTNFPDALTGSVMAAKNHAPILLVQADVTPDKAAIAFVKKNAPACVTVLGGVGAVPDNIVDSLLTGKPVPPKTTPAKFDPKGPMVALTFDDGPSKYTPRILNTLKQNDGRATFFVVGSRVSSYAQTVRDVIAQGSEVMGHSWDHRDLTTLSASGIRSELQKTNDAIHSAAGVRPAAFRPPYGSVSTTVKSVAKSMGLSLITWSVDPQDWESQNANTTYNRIMSHVKNGSIIICHDMYGSTAAAMERVIPELRRRDYQLVTVTELLTASGGAMQPGVVYSQK